MAKIKYDLNVMKFISLFESLTRSKVKDCVDLSTVLIFIVHENEASRAIGKSGANVKRLSHMLNRKIKIVEFNPDVNTFINNYIYPVKADVTDDDGVITIAVHDAKTKGLLIGRDKEKLNQLRSIVSRYFDVKDIKVR